MPTYDKTGAAWKNPAPEVIKELIDRARTIAVVGLSANPSRPSFRVSQYLKEAGFRVIPINPGISEVLGERAFPDLLAVGEPVDIVDIFRKGEAAPDLVEQAIRIKARSVWLQEGVISPSAFKRGEEAGLIMVMDRCLLKEHSRLEATG